MRTAAEPHAAIAYGTYVWIWAALMVLTGVTVGISYLDLHHITVTAALLIASVKASLVVLYFMHLRYDPPLFRYMFVVGLFFLAITLLLIYSDYGYR